MSVSLESRVRTPPDVYWRMVGDELVLLHLEKEHYFGLDPVGARMYQTLAEAETIADAYAFLAQEFEVEPIKLRDDLMTLVGQLVEQGLLTVIDAT